MSIERHLERWTRAGLLDADQAARILAYEHGRSRPVLGWAIAGLGGLAIAIGLVSIVASNWDGIPGRAKISCDVALLLGIGATYVRCERSGPAWGRETAAVVFYGALLASIALIGQVYQLGGEAREALVAWTVLSAPLLLRTRSWFAGLLWLAGIETTLATWLVHGAERLHDGRALAMAGIAAWVPLLALLVAQLPFVQQRRPALTTVLRDTGWAQLLIAASIGTAAFYEDNAEQEWGWFLGTGALALAFVGWLARSRLGSAAGRAQVVLLGTALVLIYVPVVVSPGELDVVAALTFVGVWWAAAVAAHRAGLRRVVSASTAVIGVRIVIVYFEVLGSLLDTGLGLVCGGALTLVLLRVWLRRHRALAAREASP